MNRRGFLVVGVGLAAGLTGCVGTTKSGPNQVRSQVGEDSPADPDAFATVGMKTQVGNTDAVPVSGVGLVYRLPGTGSSPTNNGWRTMLENGLKKQGFSHLKELLDDPNKTTSLVIVSALIPSGARKGERIDVRVTLPDESKTQSLKGGELIACDLVNFDTTANLESVAHSGQTSRAGGGLVLGSAMAKAEGPVVAGAFVPAGREGEVPVGGYREGRVWGGARVLASRPYFLILNAADANYRTVGQIAERLNATFHATADANSKVATAQSKELVMVQVPSAYRHNHYRFLLVARQVPVLPVSADSLYRRKLEDELLDPATTVAAAIKLEALGGDCFRSLRVGLENPSPWVRFAAAEALAYLGHTDGTGELAKLAEDHPALRAHCLKALASMDDAASTDRLVELMASPDPVLRYGAFVALRLADEQHAAARGVLVNNSYWLHQAAPGSPGVVHLCSDRRSEVVLFGSGHALTGPFTLPVGTEFTVSMAAGAKTARVTRIVKVKGELEEKKLECGAGLAEVLAAMAKLGGGYTEAVELLKRADRGQVLSVPLLEDAVPRELSVQQLSGFAKIDPTLVRANVEVARVRTKGPDLAQAGYDLPGDRDTDARPAEAPQRPPLSREPGRIFGPKRPAEPTPDPNAPLVSGM
ncbi:MAG: flagellar basal body P-ring protein FlgI [Gemmataceae bacterium]|nr:flagellar basal body P-ring protein FlgI [Gemmataceae bacterium]